MWDPGVGPQDLGPGERSLICLCPLGFDPQDLGPNELLHTQVPSPPGEIFGLSDLGP